MKIQRFEELRIWREAIEITLQIYPLTSKDSFAKDFALRDQIRRALISISSNIAEGFEKNNNKDFVRFLNYAKGSAGEVRSQLYIAQQLNYISEDDYCRLNDLLIQLSKQIKGLIQYLLAKIEIKHQ